jgi:tetratricopeptide (TPR) repeat protein
LAELHRQEALSPAQEAVAIYRQLAQASPGAHLDGLARSLDNLAAYLRRLGRGEEALGPAQEAVALRRKLAQESPVTHLSNLADRGGQPTTDEY